MTKCKLPSEAVQPIKSGSRVFVHGAVATPNALLEALVAQSSRHQDTELVHIHTEGPARYADPEYRDHFKVHNLFVGPNIRDKLDYESVDYVPCFLSEIPLLFRSGRLPLDVALLHLSPPDQHGFCTLGTSVDVAKAAFESAEIVIAQINSNMPRVHGDGFIHISELDAYVEVDTPLPEPRAHAPTPQETAVGRYVADIIEDGSTLQVGVGAVPDAILAALNTHRHLGLHSETWSDSALNLIKSGAVDNSRKMVHPGKSVSAFVTGSRKLYDFVNDNPSVVQLGTDYVNSPNIIARNPKVAAINSAVEIDLTGQVCADSVGVRIISGVGGQMDFMRGAALSPGGKPIIALTSRTKKGESRVVPFLKKGAGVVTTRAHVHYVATEYGVADLFGKSLNQRAKALIQIAHPESREELEREWLKHRS